MQTEFEVKFYPVTKRDIRKKLSEMSAVLVSPDRLMRRTIFGGELNKNLNVSYIRVRDEGDVVRVSAKQHADEGGNIEDQKESDYIASDYDLAVSVFKLAGLYQTAYQENLRETWMLDGVEIVIDTWPGLPNGIEIEASSEQLVRETAEKLGFNWEDRIITSIVEVYASTYNVSIDVVLKQLKHLTFEEPGIFDKQFD